MSLWELPVYLGEVFLAILKQLQQLLYRPELLRGMFRFFSTPENVFDLLEELVKAGDFPIKVAECVRDVFHIAGETEYGEG